MCDQIRLVSSNPTTESTVHFTGQLTAQVGIIWRQLQTMSNESDRNSPKDSPYH